MHQNLCCDLKACVKRVMIKIITIVRCDHVILGSSLTATWSISHNVIGITAWRCHDRFVTQQGAVSSAGHVTVIHLSRLTTQTGASAHFTTERVSHDACRCRANKNVWQPLLTESDFINLSIHQAPVRCALSLRSTVSRWSQGFNQSDPLDYLTHLAPEVQ